MHKSCIGLVFTIIVMPNGFVVILRVFKFIKVSKKLLQQVLRMENFRISTFYGEDAFEVAMSNSAPPIGTY